MDSEKKELNPDELEQANGGEDSGYIHDIARDAEERKTGPILSNVTWTHMKVIANSIWKKLWD